MAGTFAIAAHRAIVKAITKKAMVVEMPVNAPGSTACRYTHIVSSVPCLVRVHIAAPKDGDPTSLEIGDVGVQYIPADTPTHVIGAHNTISVRSIDRDGVVCIAPLASM